MSDCMVGVATGEYTFNFEHIVEAAPLRWEAALFFPAQGRAAASTYGHLQIHRPDTHDVVLDVALLRSRGGMGLEGDPEVAAEFIAWITTLPGFPSDGSVVAVSWSDEIVPLTPSMTADRLLAIRA